MVRPRVSKVMVATIGRPVVAAPATAAASSSADEIVSIQSRSAPPSASACGLLGEHRLALGQAEAAHGCEDVARRAHVARDQHRTAGRLARLAREARRRPVELGDPLLRMVQRQAPAVGAEAVGQQDVAAGLDEAPMDGAHLVRPLDVPELRRAAALEAALEQARAHRTVGEDHASFAEQAGERIHRC